LTVKDLINDDDPHSILGERVRQFSGEASKEQATYFRDQQKIYWLQLTDSFGEQDNLTQRIFGILTTALQRDQMFIVMPDGRSYSVQGQIPLLDQQKVSKAQSAFNAKSFAAAVLAECAILFQNQQLTQLIDFQLLLELMGYLNGGISSSETRSYLKQQRVGLTQLASSAEEVAS